MASFIQGCLVSGFGKGKLQDIFLHVVLYNQILTHLIEIIWITVTNNGTLK